MFLSLTAADSSEELEEVVEAVAIRSISWLGRTRLEGIWENRSGDASRSLRSISLSASFMMAVVLDCQSKCIKEVCFVWSREGGREEWRELKYSRSRLNPLRTGQGRLCADDGGASASGCLVRLDQSHGY